MDSDLEEAYNLITTAVCAEDIFGRLFDRENRSKAPLDVLQSRYDSLARKVDPEQFKSSPEDKELAADARSRLEESFEKAKSLLETGFYGAARNGSRRIIGGLKFRTAKRSYEIDTGSPIAEGTISTVFGGNCLIGDSLAGSIAVKIADDEKYNDLLWREKRALAKLHAANGVQRKHLPILLDQFQISDGRAGLIFRHLDGCLTLSQMRDRYRGSLEEKQKHMAWMFNRLLSAVGYAHSQGVVHENIEPESLMFRLKDHNLFLIDWAFAAIEPRKTGDGFRISNPYYSPPEEKEKGQPIPASDMYSIGKCMIFFLDGDLETDELPDYVEEELGDLLRYCVMKSKHQRAQDAWQMHGMLKRIVEKLWGPRKFLAYPI